MINLLPVEEKRQLRAGRTNVLLLRYNLFLIGAMVFLGLAIGVTYLYLTSTKMSAQQSMDENAAQAGSYASVESQADQFRSNLVTAKQILDREVVYTNVILEIAKILPSGIVLENLNLDAETFGTETTLSAQAKDYASALALKDAFQKSSMFSEVHFQSISINETPNISHPVTVSLNVTISKDAAK